MSVYVCSKHNYFPEPMDPHPRRAREEDQPPFHDTWPKPTRYSHATGGVLFVRVPTIEFRHVGDKYADLIQEAIDNLGMDYADAQIRHPRR